MGSGAGDEIGRMMVRALITAGCFIAAAGIALGFLIAWLVR